MCLIFALKIFFSPIKFWQKLHAYYAPLSGIQVLKGVGLVANRPWSESVLNLEKYMNGLGFHEAPYITFFKVLLSQKNAFLQCIVIVVQIYTDIANVKEID